MTRVNRLLSRFVLIKSENRLKFHFTVQGPACLRCLYSVLHLSYIGLSAVAMKPVIIIINIAIIIIITIIIKIQDGMIERVMFGVCWHTGCFGCAWFLVANQVAFMYNQQREP